MDFSKIIFCYLILFIYCIFICPELYMCNCSLCVVSGESVSSETSNGYLNDADAGLLSWNALEEEPDSSSAHDMSVSVTVDTESQRSLLLSHTDALAGTWHKHITGSSPHPHPARRDLLSLSLCVVCRVVMCLFVANTQSQSPIPLTCQWHQHPCDHIYPFFSP